VEIEHTSGPSGETVKRDVSIRQAMTSEPQFKLDLPHDQGGVLVEPPPVADLGPGHLCPVCQRFVIEHDGFCAAYGPSNGRWACNECIFQERLRGSMHAPPLKGPMNRGQLEAAQENLTVGIRNLCVIEGFKARDPTGACRDIPDLSLTWHETREVLEALLKVVRKKLATDG